MSYNKSHTIKDIAKEAGVSIATVSRYLNGSGYVDTETGERIEFVVQKYGYKPSRTAQTLKTRKSMQIALIVTDICNPFYSSIASTVQSLVKENGYTLALYNTNDDPFEEINSIMTAAQTNIDGIILCSIYVKNEVLNALGKTGVPVVVCNSYQNCPYDSVSGIKGEGTYLTTKHLLEGGHKRIAFAGGISESETAAERKFGYAKALTEAGMECNDKFCFEMGFSEDSGYKAGKYFSTLNPAPSAVCCANDLIALGMLRAFNELGIKVPEDISVTGMDNISYASLSMPSLTTVTNDSTEFGKTLADLLLDRILKRYEGPVRNVLIPRTLITRSSTTKLG